MFVRILYFQSVNHEKHAIQFLFSHASPLNVTHRVSFHRSVKRDTLLGAWFLSKTQNFDKDLKFEPLIFPETCSIVLQFICGGRCGRVSSDVRTEAPSHAQMHDCLLDSVVGLHRCGAGGKGLSNVFCMNPCVRDVPPSTRRRTTHTGSIAYVRRMSGRSAARWSGVRVSG